MGRVSDRVIVHREQACFHRGQAYPQKPRSLEIPVGTSLLAITVEKTPQI